MTVSRAALALVVISMVLIGAGIWALRSNAVAQMAPLCMDSDMREQVRGLVLDGFDQALKHQAQQLFEIWMKDEREQPRRAETGMRNAISAYMRSRASAQKWNPPRCP